MQFCCAGDFLLSEVPRQLIACPVYNSSYLKGYQDDGGTALATYLVTGGAGFIGGHLVEALVRRGENVRVLDNLATGKRTNIEPFLDHIEFIEGDICDAAALARAMNGVTYCLHQAALGSVPRSIANPLASNQANVIGSINVYLAAREAGVKRVLAASSSSVYGPQAPVPTPESAPLSPASPYAVSKAAAAMYGEVFSHIYGTEIALLRYFNVFGPRQDPTSQYAAVIPRFVTSLLKGEAPMINGDGRQSRDFTFVENVVEANLAACACPNRLSGTYNVACGGTTTILRLYELISQELGLNIAPTHGPPRPGDISRSFADIARAKEAFGYAPRVSVEEGVRRTVAWYRAQYAAGA